MRIAVFGVGGVGGYFGGRLAQAGHEVAFIARGQHLQALQRDGLRVESVLGDFTLGPLRTTDRPAEVGEVELVLLAVKTWQVPDAARELLPLVGPETAVIPLQNGIEAADQLAEVVGRERVLPGIAKIFSFVGGPGRIRHIGGPASITFAEWDNRPSARAERIQAALREAGIAVEPTEDIHTALWTKFLMIVPLGGVGAVSRAPVGVLRSSPETRRLLETAMREVHAVARSRGVRLGEGATDEALSFLDAQPPEGTSSLQRDIAAGRPSELEAWSGAVVRLGRSAGVPTPLHEFIYASLLSQERRARGELEFAG